MEQIICHGRRPIDAFLFYQTTPERPGSSIFQKYNTMIGHLKSHARFEHLDGVISQYGLLVDRLGIIERTDSALMAKLPNEKQKLIEIYNFYQIFSQANPERKKNKLFINNCTTPGLLSSRQL